MINGLDGLTRDDMGLATFAIQYVRLTAVRL